MKRIVNRDSSDHVVGSDPANDGFRSINNNLMRLHQIQEASGVCSLFARDVELSNLNVDADYKKNALTL